MQRFSSIFSFTCFYLVGIPLAIVLIFFFKLDIYGFWFGMLVAVILIDLMLIILVIRLDFNQVNIVVQKNIRDNALVPSSYGSTSECLELLPLKTTCDLTNAELHGSKQGTDSLRSKKSWTKLLSTKLIVLFVFVVFFTISAMTSYI